jgi:hypothetical protein
MSTVTIAVNSRRGCGSLQAWALQRAGEMHSNKVAVALANKLARIARAVWHHERTYNGNYVQRVAAELELTNEQRRHQENNLHTPTQREAFPNPWQSGRSAAGTKPITSVASETRCTEWLPAREFQGGPE